MKSIHVCSAAALAALSLFTVGCNRHVPTEAELFGYKGEDLVDETNQQYLVTGVVTNWLPERVLSVLEHYELTTNELAIVNAAGALMPGESRAEMPSDYTKDAEEPWFVWWTKPVTSFGLEGKTGTLTHFNDEKAVWESNESYFSSYWKTREEAESAAAKIRAELEKPLYGVKKFYPLVNGWVAEQVRLCVMCVVGQKADGTWSCMMDLRDKCNSGCGPWEPLEEQAERRAQYEYAKAMKVWKTESAAILAKNHELVSAAAQEKGLPGFAEEAQEMDAGDGRTVRLVSGATEPLASDADPAASLEALWADRTAALEKALGVAAQGEATRQEYPGEGSVMSQMFKSDLYEARLDAFMPSAPAAPAEGESAQETAERPPVRGQWRIAFGEVLQPGLELPARPQLAK